MVVGVLGGLAGVALAVRVKVVENRVEGGILRELVVVISPIRPLRSNGRFALVGQLPPPIFFSRVTQPSLPPATKILINPYIPIHNMIDLKVVIGFWRVLHMEITKLSLRLTVLNEPSSHLLGEHSPPCSCL